jgi:hypothetical protein
MTLNFNRGRRRKTLPDLTSSRVEFVEAKQQKHNPERWVVVLNINGWPHDIAVWAKDELDVMKQVFAWQRGEQPLHAFDQSK